MVQKTAFTSTALPSYAPDRDPRWYVFEYRVMSLDPEHILSILDRCCDTYAFPMLDNGYLYLAGTRLTLHRSDASWAMVIELFGFSPRSGLPDTHIHTFADQLHDRDPPERYVTREAYKRYLGR